MDEEEVEEVEDEEGRKRKEKKKKKEKKREKRERGEKLFDNLVPMDRVTNGLKHHAVVDDDNFIKS